MFKAIFQKHWCDFEFEYEEIEFDSIEKILDYVYMRHKNSIYPSFSSFYCRGCKPIGGCLEAHHSLKERFGYKGSLCLEKILYYKDNSNDEIIIFSKDDKYISPKATKAFNDFAIVAQQKDKNKIFGDY